MRPDPDPVPPSEPKLLDQIRGRLRVKHNSSAPSSLMSIGYRGLCCSTISATPTSALANSER